jgi:hypothetical protein
VFLLAALTATGQVTSTATLTGTITDPTGAAVPGADVVVTNSATGAVFKISTTESGEFTIPSLPASTYSVVVTHQGFKQAKVGDVVLDVGVPTAIRLTLEVGSQSESVTVQAEGAVLQTQTAAVQTTLTGRQLTELPLVSRDGLDLALTMPGVTTPGRPRTSIINGLSMGATNITLDGINVEDNLIKSTDGYFTYVRPRIDAIGEVTVNTAASGADSAGEGAVQIKFATRSGTNEYHGSLYEYNRNPYYNANYWFQNRDVPADPRTGKAPNQRVILNQYGARVGGPISIPGLLNGKNKAFFFVNYEEYRLPEQTLRTRTILDPLTQSGVFQYKTAAGVQQVNLLNLATANGQTNTIDPTIGKLLADIRATTTQGSIVAATDPNLQNFSFVAVGGQKRRFPTVRLDYNINQRNSLEMSYNYQAFSGLVDFLNNTDPAFPGFPNHGSQGSNRFSGVIALRSTLTSRLVNELRAGLTGGTVLFFPEINAGQFANQQGFSLGIGAAGITSATVSTSPSRRNTPTKQINDNLTWSRGAHNIGFGFAYTQINSWQFSQAAAPTVSIGVDATDPASAMFSAANFAGASSTDLSNAKNIYAVLTGRITAINATARLNESGSQYVYLGPDVQRFQQRENGYYVTDNWRIKPNLTITTGLRWEIQFPFTPENNKYAISSYDGLYGISGAGNIFKPGTQTGAVTTFNALKPGQQTYDAALGNFAPSIGIAWTPNFHGWMAKLLGAPGKTVLRGGYSIAYTRESAGFYSGQYGANPQANLQANIAAGRGTTFKYAGPNTGTSPLPIMLAYFSGLPAAQAGDATKYTSSNFSNSTYYNTLAINQAAPFTFISNMATGSATQRASAISAGLPSNFFVVNPDKLGGAFILTNFGGSNYNAGTVEFRRRLSDGLLFNVNYTLANSTQDNFVSFRLPAVRMTSNLNIRQALKMNWIYELPFGKGKPYLASSNGFVDRLVGGWEIHGTGRVQSGSPINLGDVRLVGMTRDDLQAAMGPRFNDGAKIAYYLPQDIIDNTFRAFNTSATTANGYSSNGAPTGRYIAPANSATCIETFTGQCGGTRLILFGPHFTRFDVSAVKKIRIRERFNAELRGEFLDIFNNINFVIGSAGNNTNSATNFSSATYGQITSAYQDTSTTNDPGGRLIQLVLRINF